MIWVLVLSASATICFLIGNEAYRRGHDAVDAEVAVMLQIFDGLLLLIIVVLAWRSLSDRDVFRGVVSFIALGLLIAVAWVRLRAPDVALAEAAVGSGLTGALILSALVRMCRREQAATAKRPEESK